MARGFPSYHGSGTQMKVGLYLFFVQMKNADLSFLLQTWRKNHFFQIQASKNLCVPRVINILSTNQQMHMVTHEILLIFSTGMDSNHFRAKRIMVVVLWKYKLQQCAKRTDARQRKFLS